MYTYFLNGICDKFGIDSSSLDDESLSLIKQAYDELQSAEKPKKKSSFPWLKVLGGTALAAGGAYAGGKYLNGGQNFLTPFTNKVDSLFQKAAPEAPRINASPSVETKPSLPSPSADAENPDGSFNPHPRFMDRLKSWLKPTPSPTGDMPFDLDHGPDALTQSLNKPPTPITNPIPEPTPITNPIPEPTPKPKETWGDRLEKTWKAHEARQRPPTNWNAPENQEIPDASATANPAPAPEAGPSEEFLLERQLDEAPARAATRASNKALAQYILEQRDKNNLSYLVTKANDFRKFSLEEITKTLETGEANWDIGTPDENKFQPNVERIADLSYKTMLGHQVGQLASMTKPLRKLGPVLNSPAVNGAASRLLPLAVMASTAAQNDPVKLVGSREADDRNLGAYFRPGSPQPTFDRTRMAHKHNLNALMRNGAGMGLNLLNHLGAPGKSIYNNTLTHFGLNHALSSYYPDKAEEILKGNNNTIEDLAWKARGEYLNSEFREALSAKNPAYLNQLYRAFSPKELKAYFPEDPEGAPQKAYGFGDHDYISYDDLRRRVIDGHPDSIPEMSRFNPYGKKLHPIPIPQRSSGWKIDRALENPFPQAFPVPE